MKHIDLFKPNITEESIALAGDVLRSGWIGLGPKTKEFETEFAKYVGVRYCVALNSCTSALHLAVKLLDLPKGSEVITTPMTFVSTNEVILYEGLKPKFVDIEYGTLNLDYKKVAKAVNHKTRAIMCVHFGGQPCDMDELYSLGLPIIEDAAHAAGASYKGKHVGYTNNLTCWSFHAVKNLPMGDGGAITTCNEKYYNRLLELRWMGINKSTYARSNKGYSWRYDVNGIGYKYHANDISCAIGLGQLKVLDAHNKRRQEIVDYYMTHLDTSIVTLPEYKSDRISSNHIFHVKVENRDELLDYLDKNGVSCGVHYFPNNKYPIFPNTKLPVCDDVAPKIISLPLHTLLSDEDVETVCKLINSFK